MNRTNLLITGRPGIGKTSLIRKLYEEFREHGPVGFLTEEIREAGVRRGFSMASFDGRSGVLAHVDTPSSKRVGKYGVDVPAFETFLRGLDLPGATGKLVIIDEIGKMECLSSLFRGQVAQLLDSRSPFVATIAQKGDRFIRDVKSRPDIVTFEITRHNRDSLFPDIAGQVRTLLGE